MKKICLVLMLALLLSGCGKKKEETPPVVSQPPAASSIPAEKEPVALESLTVEFLRAGNDGAVLMQAVKKLPEEITAAFAAADVTVEDVKVTMSGSCAATAQAVAEGGVSLAILPVAELTALEHCPEAAALAGERRMDLCLADTAYGRNLAGREAPTWTELDHARWGVLEQDLVGRDAVELWLADHYEGNALADLSDVTEYEDWESLLAAAAAGEIDVYPAEESSGAALLGESEPLYAVAAVVSEERIIPVLPDVLSALQKGEFAALFGSEPYVSAPEGALDAQKRLATLLG